MKLVAVTVKNYRSITKAYKLHLGGSTVLIGRNNEGKSNILRALVTSLEFLRRGRQVQLLNGRITYVMPPHQRQRLYNWENDYPIALQASQPQGTSEITLEFELDKSELKALRNKIGSTINGTLPIRILLGPTASTVSIPKQGPGAKGLTSKVSQIADFIRAHLEFQYIPAVRTAKRAQEVVDDMVATALEPLEDDPKYKAALKTIADLQKPVLENISDSIKGTLIQFLPAITNVKVQIVSEERFRALRTSTEIIVDDGTPTPLGHKGDGVQSLAAIALMRRAAALQGTKYAVIALEEPETHLHPEAIHELRAVLQELAKNQQIVITTHCPLFVDRTTISANIVVGNNKAQAAKSIEEIRTVLGVRAADNLRHAELMVVVEGNEDVVSLTALLSIHSPLIKQALANGTVVVTSLNGATNLSYKLGLLRDSLCGYHCYLDNDDAGKKSFEDALQAGLVSVNECTFTICNGMAQAEFEDLYSVDVYRTIVEQKYGVVLDRPEFRTNSKWADRMRQVFLGQGKLWNDRIKSDLKAAVAGAVVVNPGVALNVHKRSSFDALVRSIEYRITELHRA